VKNNYPLPLILNVVENIDMKKVFIKMDLKWGYNNVRIKERDEWKAVFTTSERSFKLTVIVRIKNDRLGFSFIFLLFFIF